MHILNYYLMNCLPPPIFTPLSAVLSHVHTALIIIPSWNRKIHESKQQNMWTLSGGGEGGYTRTSKQSCTPHAIFYLLNIQTQPD